MCNEVSKILDEEQSVKAPIIESTIQTTVQAEMYKMQNRIKQGSIKIDQANKKLTQLKQQQNSPKDRAVANNLQTKANKEYYPNSTVNLRKRRQRNQRQHESNSNSNPTQTPISKEDETSTPPNQSSTRNPILEKKEKKRLRNLRQRDNRKKRKLESQDEANSDNATIAERN